MSIIKEVEKMILDKDLHLSLNSEIVDEAIRTDSLETFLENFFTSYNNKFSTYYKDSEKVQTSRGRYRSLGDVFLICRNYYPECTLAEVLYYMIEVLPAKIALFTWYCPDINKRVWFLRYNEVGDVHRRDEFGYYYKDYKEELNNKEKAVSA